MKTLEDSQLEAFDTEFVDDLRWEHVKTLIDKEFSHGEFRFLDIGGGNGTFSDRILKAYPKATATVLDNSELLISRNQKHPRKSCICDSVSNLFLIEDRFDLISVNWLLHHLVGESYLLTQQNQLATLKEISRLLSDKGRISIFENIYEGWLIEDLPSRLIYQFTSAKMISKFTKALGANTAGVGVCFLSKRQWLTCMNNAGLTLLNYSEPDDWKWQVKALWRIFLHLGERRIGHFWLCSKKIAD